MLSILLQCVFSFVTVLICDVKLIYCVADYCFIEIGQRYLQGYSSFYFMYEVMIHRIAHMHKIQLHIPGSSSSLVITVKPKIKEIFHMPTVFYH
jgi:hypothetical protein